MLYESWFSACAKFLDAIKDDFPADEWMKLSITFKRQADGSTLFDGVELVKMED